SAVVIQCFEKGTVGKQVLTDVLKNDSYTKVAAFDRRPVELDKSMPQDNLVKNRYKKTVDFDHLEAHRDAFRNVSDGLCCLATSRAEASSA
ncbi:hypothetical protein HMPREF1544_07637, partial [Mucor circinelloides 1006PhL]